MSDGTLSIKDSRTGRNYEIPIRDNAILATSLKQIKGPAETANPADKVAGGLRCYDPGLKNTAPIKSSLTWIDGEKGVLLFQGYSIEQLWDCDFEDILHLMLRGDLPSLSQREGFRQRIANAMRDIPQSVVDVVRSFPRSSPMMPVVMAGLSCYVGNQPDSIPANRGGNIYHGNGNQVDAGIIRTVAAFAVVVGLAASHLKGTSFCLPSRDRTFYENLFVMMGHVDPSTGEPNHTQLSCFRHFGALSVDHGLSNSTLTLLVTASTLPDPTSALISALASAYGPLHFGASESAFRVMTELGSPDRVPALIKEVKQGKRRLFGYGHRSYKTVDPRIRPIQKLLQMLDAQSNPLFAVAQEIDRVASQDEYFVSRGLKANADLYGQFFYTAMGWPPSFIPLMMIIHRLPGLMGHWHNAMLSEIMVYRPPHLYVGPVEKRAPLSAKL